LLPLLSQAFTQISAWAQVAGIDCNDNFHWFLSDQHSDTFSVFLYHSLERKHCNSLISLNRYSPLWSRSATPFNFLKNHFIISRKQLNLIIQTTSVA
jgi:hypothetical protein